MNLRTKERILEIANERRTGISAAKGPEYTGSAENYSDDDRDILANFKRQGERWGSSPILPMGIYFGKHIDSIETFVREATKEGVTLEEQQELAYRGEGIQSRLDDARNYLDLMECLLVEQGILNDPRPEAYRPTPMLRDLGPISGEDVIRATQIDGGDELAEDYNYMRARVDELRRDADEYKSLYYKARDSAARLAEEALEASMPDEPDTWDALKDVVP